MHTTIWKGLSLICVWAILSFPLGNTSAQATDSQFTTNITYQNVGTTVAHPTILYYPASSTSPVSINRPELPVGASTTISAGVIDLNEVNSQGSAIVKSDVPIAVLMTQVSDSAATKAIAIAAGSSTGTPELWFVNVQKGSEPSKLAVQNVDGTNNNISLKFFANQEFTELKFTNLKPGSSVIVNLADRTELVSDFYTAVQVVTTRSSDGSSGRVVGTHWIGSDTINTSLEGISQLGKKVYMPLAMCQSTAGMTSSYFVYNTDPSAATRVKVTYNSGKYESKDLAASSGAWFNACTPSGTNVGYTGSGIITSSTTNVIATGLIKNGGVKTNFIGQTTGSSQLAIPYAVYSASQYTTRVRQRTSIQIQNLGGALPDKSVKVKYFDKNGNLVGTHLLGALANGARRNSTPANLGTIGNEFGYYSDGSSGGSAIIMAPKGSQIMATVWVLSMTASNTYTGEMYNAIPVTE